MSSLHDHATAEHPRPSLREAGAGLMWCPLAEAVTPHMRTRGKYADRYPRGAVVHYTAGHDRSEEDARASLSFGREQGYCFFVIGPTGRIYQSFPLDEWGYHAGESAWLGLGTNVSSKLVGIEVACAGLLDADRKSWFGTTYLQSETRRLAASSGHGGPAGTYRSFRAQQEEALIGLLRWLKSNNPAVFDCRNVLGHHEVSGELGIGRWRKQDPGGALSMPMDQLRALL